MTLVVALVAFVLGGWCGMVLMGLLNAASRRDDHLR